MNARPLINRTLRYFFSLFKPIFYQAAWLTTMSCYFEWSHSSSSQELLVSLSDDITECLHLTHTHRKHTFLPLDSSKPNVIHRGDTKLSLDVQKKSIFFVSCLISWRGKPGCGCFTILIYLFSAQHMCAARPGAPFPPSGKAVMLHKPLNQCWSATQTGNSFSFTDIIKKYMVRNTEGIFTNKSGL